MKHILGLLIVVSLALSLVFAAPGLERQAAETASGASIGIPAHAVQLAPNIYSLGTATDIDGRIVEGIMIIHRKQNAKPDWAGGGKKDNAASSCYSFIAKGAKWKNVEPWIMDTTNPQNISGSALFTQMQADMAKWEDAGNANIFGIGSTGTGLIADETSTDGLNEVFFASLADSNTIAVTISWGIFGGPPRGRELVEWDMVFNNAYIWDMGGAANAMDFSNIATHEIGHAAGMGHADASECVDETMYPYATLGETQKRTLEAGDIAGISKLY